MQNIFRIMIFTSADYNDINLELDDIDWDTFFANHDIDGMTSLFDDKLKLLIDSYVPQKRIKVDSFPPWFSNELRNLTFEKKRAHLAYKKSRSHNDYVRFSSIRAQAKNLSNFLYRNYWGKIENSVSTNLKKFCNHINGLKKSTKLPNTMFLNDSSASTLPDIADLFAANFESVFAEDLPSDMVFDFEPQVELSSLSIELSEISEALTSLNTKAGAGLDEISNLFLERAKTGLIRPLWLLFNNKSLSTGRFPTNWKSSLVLPIFKNGSRNNIENYRPIAILNAIPKLFEKIVTQKLKSLLENSFVREQHGFLPGKSTTSNLTLFNNTIFKNLDDITQTDVIYTDFAKAFDRVSHTILIRKLSAWGFSDSVLDWMISYLSNRSYTVKLDWCIFFLLGYIWGTPRFPFRPSSFHHF